ncbi:uncharacterized protein [Melanerpes formicivorus]|uniref:uncharacterized protein n=1 Tax=Melanerpes formicivorus TaxID=211600 RepID=UPI00358EBE4D
MGQGSGKQTSPGKNGSERVPRDMPPDSPLGLQLAYWEENPNTRGKDQGTMIYYCMEKWAREKIRSDNLFWPQYGSSEGWICQALNLYVNSKEPFNQEESEYAACWKGSVWSAAAVTVFKVEEEEEPEPEKWEPLNHLPPPYNPAVPAAPVLPAAPLPSAATAPAPPQRDTLANPSAKGEEVLLTTETAVRTAERGWTHATRVKGPVDPPSEWTVVPQMEDLRMVIRRVPVSEQEW